MIVVPDHGRHACVEAGATYEAAPRVDRRHPRLIDSTLCDAFGQRQVRPASR